MAIALVLAVAGQARPRDAARAQTLGTEFLKEARAARRRWLPRPMKTRCAQSGTRFSATNSPE